MKYVKTKKKIVIAFQLSVVEEAMGSHRTNYKNTVLVMQHFQTMFNF